MPEWTPAFPFPGGGRTVISPLAPESLGGVISATPTSGAWPSANRAIYVPFRTATELLVAQLWLLNGSANGNNFDIAVYDEAGNRRISSGSTAQGTVSTLQAVDVTDTLIAPGLYYLALAFNGTTSTTMNMTVSSAARGQWLGVAQQASAFVLPATFMLATTAFVSIPVFGLTGRAVI